MGEIYNKYILEFPRKATLIMKLLVQMNRLNFKLNTSQPQSRVAFDALTSYIYVVYYTIWACTFSPFCTVSINLTWLKISLQSSFSKKPVSMSYSKLLHVSCLAHLSIDFVWLSFSFFLSPFMHFPFTVCTRLFNNCPKHCYTLNWIIDMLVQPVTFEAVSISFNFISHINSYNCNLYAPPL